MVSNSAIKGKLANHPDRKAHGSR